MSMIVCLVLCVSLQAPHISALVFFLFDASSVKLLPPLCTSRCCAHSFIFRNAAELKWDSCEGLVQDRELLIDFSKRTLYLVCFFFAY